MKVKLMALLVMLSFITSSMPIVGMTQVAVAKGEQQPPQEQKVIDPSLEKILDGMNSSDNISVLVYLRGDPNLDRQIQTIWQGQPDDEMHIISESLNEKQRKVSKELKTEQKQLLKQLKQGDQAAINRYKEVEGKYGITEENTRTSVQRLTELHDAKTSQITALEEQTYLALHEQVTQKIEQLPATKVTSSNFLLNSLGVKTKAGNIPILAAIPEVIEIAYNSTGVLALNVSRSAINAGAVQEYFGKTGYGQCVSIVDGGIGTAGDPNLHQSLTHLVTSGRYFEAHFPTDNQSCDGYDRFVKNGVYGHGTRIASIIASNDYEFQGIAPGATILNCKFCNGAWENARDAAIWATESAPVLAKVINLSSIWSPGATSGMSIESRDVDRIVYARNVDFVTATGDPNTQGWRSIPADAFNTIAVGAVTDCDTSETRADDHFVPDINLSGPTDDGRIKPDIVAPGLSICSADPNHDMPNTRGFNATDGTSLAAPHVSGVALLLREGGVWDSKVMRALLLNTAEDWSRSDPGSSTDGPDNNTGYGYVDAWHAYLERADVYLDTLTQGGSIFYKGEVSDLEDSLATLVWDRYVDQNRNVQMNNLDLYAYDENSNSEITHSASSIDNRERIKINNGYNGYVVIKVKGITINLAEPYALALEPDFGYAMAPALNADISNPSSVIPGTNFIVSVSATNQGDVKAHNVEAMLTVPAGFTIVSGSNPQNLGSIDGGSTQSATWTVRAPTSTGNYTLSTSITSSSYNEIYNDDLTNYSGYIPIIVGVGISGP